ncbi:hypothetical protein [Roseimicrobium sp. ORNL1]|uniref:hypothetical protein n=1 Tax=Roseimicrobium sp. ORNL1 TaxID=2711231 RepID=UPI0013E191C3|nr:hypothetical protein [Roseimicrobium sp. ORNL1]QIF03956.1 hypothetical protein G5S37_21300 [Roseimicrobium sp. ORNL1]
MTVDQLIEEGRKLQRPCVFLTPDGSGPAAAEWYELDSERDAEDSAGFRRWLTIDAQHIPGAEAGITGYVSIFTDEEKCVGGRVEVTPSWPDRAGTLLYAHAASVLPPIEAVFAKGSEAVGDWLEWHNWDRTWRYNGNFKGAAIAEAYIQAWMREYPIYLSSPDIYAVLGGWHFPMSDDDWLDLMDEQLMVFTLRDSEPWVEAWRTGAGEFKVFQRIT